MKRVGSLFFDLYLEIAPLFVLIFEGFVYIRGIVINLGNGNGSEFIPKIVERHEENTVIFIKIKSKTSFFIWIYIVPVRVIV